MFWTGMVLTPLLLQGWIPQIATFLNTPGLDHVRRVLLLRAVSLDGALETPRAARASSGQDAGASGCVGLIPGALYIFFNPDGIPHPDRWSWGPWLQALKYTPLPHLASFVFGVLLASLDELIGRTSRLRILLGVFGFVATFTILSLAAYVPYAILHDGLLMPFFGCMILGLAGNNWLAYGFGWRPLVFVGEASYCLYLLHFNLWNLIHDSHVLNRFGLSRSTPGSATRS